MKFVKIDQKCSCRMFMVYVYEHTLENPDYTFNSKELSGHFGCSNSSSCNVLRSLHFYGNITKLKENTKLEENTGIKKRKYRITNYKITNLGIKYALWFKKKLDAEMIT